MPIQKCSDRNGGRFAFYRATTSFTDLQLVTQVEQAVHREVLRWFLGSAWAQPQVDTLKITDDDAAFILGKGGKTKEKPLSIAV